MLASINVSTLSQLKGVIKQLKPSAYTLKSSTLNGSSIGQHVRHILEFYQCLLKGAKSGVVNYDIRRRDLRIENESSFALSLIDSFIEILCSDQVEDLSLTNEMELMGITIKSKSSFDRELVYLMEHSIHHYAIINIALRLEHPHITVDKNFGVAPSTIAHQEEVCSELSQN
jgi:uncharacterized damage-inducible protein DinB